MLGPNEIEGYIQILRDAVPKGLTSNQFLLSESFFTDFEKFKPFLISYLADQVEYSIRNVSGDVSETTLSGFLDASLKMLRNIAEIQLIQEVEVSDPES